MAVTQQLFVAVVDGEVPQCPGHGTHHAVVAVGQQLRHHGQTLLQPHRGPDVAAVLQGGGGAGLEGRDLALTSGHKRIHLTYPQVPTAL